MLGRRPSRRDPRTLSFHRYASSGLPPAPLLVDWSKGIDRIREYRNREIGVCSFASAAHIVTIWNAKNGRDVAPTQLDVELAYSHVGGYDATDSTTWDNGADMLSTLSHWRRDGIGGHRIRAYLKLDPRDVDELRLAAHLFGPLYCGASLPLRAQRQTWWHIDRALQDQSDTIGSWGGHAMACPRMDRTGGEFFTWGHRQRFTWAWWCEYVDEVYCLLSDEWADVDGAPNGFDFSTLERDLRAIGAL